MIQSVHVIAEDGSLFQVDFLGLDTTLSTDEKISLVGDYWAPLGWQLSESGAQVVARRFIIDVTSESSLSRFESDFGLYLSEKLAGFVAVHAALIRIADHLIVVPGTSGVGKSTLSLVSLQAGYQVWSDEYCLIDTETGEVSGWPRPVRERLVGGGLRRIPLPGPHGPGVATHVLMLKFDSQTEGVELSPLSPGDVALGLLANTVCARSRPEESFRAAARLARSVSGWTGTRGEVTEALARLPEVLRESLPA